MTPSHEFLRLHHRVKNSLSVSFGLCLHMANCCGLFGLLYVLVKLLTNISSKSNQQLILPAGRLFSHTLAGPSNICGTYRTAHLKFPPAISSGIVNQPVLWLGTPIVCFCASR